MAVGDKMRGRKDATGDRWLAQEGQNQRRRGNLRLAWEKLKDSFRR
jgi:hypothetical protein